MRIFVNTLARFDDRKALMKTQLEELSLSFEFFEGPDSKALTQAQLNGDYNEGRTLRNLGRIMSKSEIACTTAHRDIYRKMLAEGIEKAFILEDDVLLDIDLPEILAFIDGLPLSNMVVKLDNYREKSTPCSIWRRRRVNETRWYKKPVTAQWMTWGYVIDSKAAASIIGAWPKIEFVCDDWKRMCSVVGIRCVQPAPVHDNLKIVSNLAEGRKELARESEKKRGSVVSAINRGAHLVKTLLRMALP